MPRPDSPNRAASLARTVPSTAALYDAILATPGLVAFWPLDDGVGSASIRELVVGSALSGTVTGTVATSGMTGLDNRPTVYFDGSGGGVTINHNTLFNQAAFTWEIWMAPRNLMATTGLSYFGAVQSDYRFGFLEYQGRSANPDRVTSNPATRFQTTDTATAQPWWFFTGRINSFYEWHHIALANNGVSFTVYFDGQLHSTALFNRRYDDYLTVTSPLYLGGGRTLTILQDVIDSLYPLLTYRGGLQYLSLTNRALTSAEIDERWALGTALNGRGGTTYANLLVGQALLNYFPLIEMSGTTAFDLTGLQHGLYTGGPALGATGAIGPAAQFDGTQTYVPTLANLSVVPTALAAEAWVNPTAVDGVAAAIVSRGDEVAQNLQFRLGKTTGDGRISLLVQLNATAYQYTSVGAALVPNTWQHVGFSLTGGQAPIVVLNGEQVNLDSGTTVPAAVLATSPLTTVVKVAASENTPTNYFRGRLQHVAALNAAVPVSAMAQRYTAGLLAQGRAGA